MNALVKARQQANALVTTVESTALRMKAMGMMERMVSPSMLATPTDWQQQSRNREGYVQYRSWVYAAVNALAQHAATQPVRAGRKKAAEKGKKRGMSRTKAILLKSMTPVMREKASGREVELLDEHEVLTWLDRPNPLQSRAEFVQSFVANLNLTGRAFIVRDEGEEGRPEFYSIPSTWVRADHSERPWGKFHVSNPRNMDFFSDSDAIDGERVGMAYLPNPADPMSCMSPASSQSAAIRIDDRIQTTEEKFFDNGVFPSVIVTVGKQPHPNVPGGLRPRLTALQRRQVASAIRRVMGSVANYGNPAIVDGLIESITPFSRAQSEIGWDKSEQTLKARILSAFGVHPFMLGEAMNVGGYSQAGVIDMRFCARVNVFISCLSLLMTELVQREEGNEDLLIWWEAAKFNDPQMEAQAWREGRANGDVTRDEWRANRLGLPPIESERTAILTSPSVVGAVIQLLSAAGSGAISKDQVYYVLLAMGLPDDQAWDISGAGVEEEQQLGQATEALQEAVAALRRPIHTPEQLLESL